MTVQLPHPYRSNFAQDVFKLVSGTTLSQILTVLAAPLLTRLYTPEDYGISTLFGSIVGIVGMMACLRYELAIMLPESEEEAINVSGLGLFSTLIITSVAGLLIVFAGVPFVTWLRAPELVTHLWSIPVAVFLTGVLLVMNYWSSRQRKFGRLSRRQVVQSIVTLVIQLGAGLFGWATSGSLIIGSVIGSLAVTGMLGLEIWHNDRTLIVRNVRFPVMFEMLKRYRKFPLYISWATFLNTISWQLPPFLLSYFFSASVVGHYSLGNRLLRMPMSLIGGAMAEVFFPHAAAAKNNGSLPQLVESAFRRLVLFGLPISLVLGITGKDIFIVFFGSTWAEAGIYVQILSLWTFFWFISSPLSNLYFVLEKQEFILYLNIVIFITRLLSLGLGGYWGNSYLALILFSVSGVLTYGYLALAVVALSGVSWGKIIRILGQNTIQLLPFGLILVLLKGFRVSATIVTIVACVISGVHYLVVVIRDPQLNTLLRQKLTKIPV